MKTFRTWHGSLLKDIFPSALNCSSIAGSSQEKYRRFLGEPFDESITISTKCFCVTDDNRHILACGYWDKSFKAFSTDSGRL